MARVKGGARPKAGKLRIRRGDRVHVLTGRSKGIQGEVVKVMPREERLIVTGVNMVARHVKPSAATGSGGIMRREAPIHISNVALIDPESGKPTRVRLGLDDDGRKVRYAVRSGRVIDR